MAGSIVHHVVQKNSPTIFGAVPLSLWYCCQSVIEPKTVSPWVPSRVRPNIYDNILQRPHTILIFRTP